MSVLGKYLAAIFPVLAVVSYLVQRYYLRTSRQLRLMDIGAKAPLYKHFIETANGASTIRAFGWESKFHEQQANKLNQSQRPFYTLFCVQQWLTLVLDLIVGALAVILVAVATSLTDALDPGSLGVALVVVLSSSALLTQTIQAWTRMESSIGAVARIQQFLTTTPSEATGHTLPPPNWPSRGAILFDEVVASYK
jgi:ABC-type multidrug transport system fused ATPase/permease subunit